MKILITGANGLLGQKLVKLILDRGEHELIATARNENRLPYPEKDYTFVHMDITDRKEVLAVIDTHQPQVIVHTAAMTNVDQCEQEKEDCRKQNVEAVGYLTDACRLAGTFFLHLSTDFIFDGADGPYDEEAQPNPISYYGESKLAAERLLAGAGIKFAIVRTVLVYGTVHDMSRANIVLWVKKNLEEGKTIKVVDDQLRSPTLAEDLAVGCYLIAQKQTEGIFNISGKNLLTPYQMAVKTALCFGLDTATMERANAANFKQIAKRPPRTGLKINKAKALLGYSPHTFEEGLTLIKNQLAANP